jgi:hypothetical protein
MSKAARLLLEDVLEHAAVGQEFLAAGRAAGSLYGRDLYASHLN